MTKGISKITRTINKEARYVSKALLTGLGFISVIYK
jgi:hypothetical protein